MRRVLFVCTGNRARSQMAEGFLRHLAGDRFEVHSAGTAPQGLSSRTVSVMREMGIDISGQWSKPVDEFAGQEFDYVITVCDSARQACPTFPGKGKRLHWNVKDPAEAAEKDRETLEPFRTARDDLRRRVEMFVWEESAESPAQAVLSLAWRKRPALFWRLLRDSRVPLPAKLVLPCLSLYLLMPLDLIPDFIPIIGHLDDLVVVILGLWLFLRLCPRGAFQEHIEELRAEALPN